MTLPPALERLTARAPDLVAALLTALLAGQLALLFWAVVGQRPAATGGARVAVAPAPATGLDSQGLLQAHLFGSAPAAAGPIQATSAPLVLTGTLAGVDPARGFAIIGENAASARLYAAGATLPVGVRLIEVYPEHVIIDRNGSRESLSLPRSLLAGAAPAPAARGAEPPIADNVQKLIAQEPALIGQVLRPQPVFANGQLRGFRLYPGTDRGKFMRLGLQPGDLVTQVNNVPIGDPQHGMDILRTLGSSPTATVTVERGGATQQITIDSAKLNAATGPADGNAPPPLQAPPDPE